MDLDLSKYPISKEPWFEEYLKVAKENNIEDVVFFTYLDQKGIWMARKNSFLIGRAFKMWTDYKHFTEDFRDMFSSLEDYMSGYDGTSLGVSTVEFMMDQFPDTWKEEIYEHLTPHEGFILFHCLQLGAYILFDVKTQIFHKMGLTAPSILSLVKERQNISLMPRDIIRAFKMCDSTGVAPLGYEGVIPDSIFELKDLMFPEAKAEETTEERKLTPFADYLGMSIYEGDILRKPCGAYIGTVSTRSCDSEEWKILSEHGDNFTLTREIITDKEAIVDYS